MRTASVLALAVASACLGCTYDIPSLETADGSVGGDGGVVSPEASGGETSGGGSDAPSHPADAGTTDGGACSGTLCACQNAGDCDSHLCAVQGTVGGDLFTAAGGQFCTNACCTSADCSGGAVCFASGQGGNYCVRPAWLGRSAPGSALGGAPCAAGSDCLSGLCTGAKLCADTCCSFPGLGECATGSQCALGAFPGAASLDTHFTGHCGTPGGADGYGASCSGNNQCAGGLCYQSGGGGNCTEPCGSSAQCESGSACQLDYQGHDIYFACFPWSGTGDQGANCTSDNNCLGAWCGTGSQCTNVCLDSSSCTVVGWKCLPEPDDLGSIGTYNVLVCEAP